MNSNPNSHQGAIIVNCSTPVVPVSTFDLGVNYFGYSNQQKK
jgi:hypothetical protein